MPSEDPLVLPSKELVRRLWNLVGALPGLQRRVPVLITGSNSFASGKDGGRYLEPLVHALADSLAMDPSLHSRLLLVGSSAHGGDSRQTGVAWDNVMQETFFNILAKDGTVPMIIMVFEQCKEEPAEGEEFSLQLGIPMTLTVRLPPGNDELRYLMAQGWKSMACSAVLGLGGGPRAAQMLRARAPDNSLSSELKPLALPVPAAGGMAMDEVRVPPPLSPTSRKSTGSAFSFRPAALSEDVWAEIAQVCEGDLDQDEVDEYSCKVLECLRKIVEHERRPPESQQDEPLAEKDAKEELSRAQPAAQHFSVGPFSFIPTSFGSSGLSLQGEGIWELTAAAGVCKLLQQVGVTSVKGHLTSRMPLTLSEEERTAAGVPSGASCCSWSYAAEPDLRPVLRTLSGRPTGKHAAELAFLAFGGFVYFESDDGMGAEGEEHRIVAASAVAPPGSSNGSSDGGRGRVPPVGGRDLHFGPGLPWEPERTAQVGIQRFKNVAIGALRDAGARLYCWLLPGEVSEAPHGAFAFLFREKDQEASSGDTRDVFFPVAGPGELLNSVVKRADEVEAGTEPMGCGKIQGKASVPSADLQPRRRMRASPSSQGWARSFSPLPRKPASALHYPDVGRDKWNGKLSPRRGWWPQGSGVMTSPKALSKLEPRRPRVLVQG